LQGRQLPGHGSQAARTVGENAFDYVNATFAHNQFFSVDQRQHGVGRSLGGLDQIAV
jgi:hypothetical protein